MHYLENHYISKTRNTACLQLWICGSQTVGWDQPVHHDLIVGGSWNSWADSWQEKCIEPYETEMDQHMCVHSQAGECALVNIEGQAEGNITPPEWSQTNEHGPEWTPPSWEENLLKPFGKWNLAAQVVYSQEGKHALSLMKGRAKENASHQNYPYFINMELNHKTTPLTLVKNKNRSLRGW